MSFLQRLLDVRGLFGERSRAGREADGWGHPDGSWFGGKLLTYSDPLHYPHADLTALTRDRRDVVWLEQPAAPYTAVAQFPEFLDQIAPPVFTELAAHLPSTRAAAFIMARSNVALSGYRTFIGRDGRYNLDESFTTEAITRIETARLGHPEVYRNEMIGFKDTSTPAIFRIDTTGKSFAEIAETVICLSSNEAPNYGSFLFRMLPKLIQVAMLDSNLRILVPLSSPNMQSLLKLAGIEQERIIPQYLDHIYHIDRAIVPSMRNRDLWLDDETLAFYDALRARYGAPHPTRRMYISRRAFKDSSAAQRRVMLNEAEVIAELAPLGFDIVEPERLSPREQIEAFSSAALIVAAGGSALFNTVFCHPGTKLIDIEAEPHWAGGHARLFKSRGLRFGIFEGTPASPSFAAPHIPFTVDVPRLLRRLRSFM